MSRSGNIHLREDVHAGNVRERRFTGATNLEEDGSEFTTESKEVSPGLWWQV